MGPIKFVYFFAISIFFPQIPFFFYILIYRNYVSVSPFYTIFTVRECEHHSVFVVFQVSFRVQAAFCSYLHIYNQHVDRIIKYKMSPDT